MFHDKTWPTFSWHSVIYWTVNWTYEPIIWSNSVWLGQSQLFEFIFCSIVYTCTVQCKTKRRAHLLRWDAVGPRSTAFWYRGYNTAAHGWLAAAAAEWPLATARDRVFLDRARPRSMAFSFSCRVANNDMIVALHVRQWHRHFVTTLNPFWALLCVVNFWCVLLITIHR